MPQARTHFGAFAKWHKNACTPIKNSSPELLAQHKKCQQALDALPGLGLLQKKRAQKP